MSWSNGQSHGAGRGLSTRLTTDRSGLSTSTKSADDFMNSKRIDRHYRINNGKTMLTIKQGDITNTKVDAIVNAANEHMTGGAGVDGIIHRAAGPQLREECYLHRQVEPGVRLPTGRSRILLSYKLSSNTSYIINTAGPVYDSFEKDRCAEELKSCYKTALALANLYDLKSIAFPAISCGIFGYPADKGAEAALQMSDQYADQLTEVMFILFDDHIYDAWLKKAVELNYSLWSTTKSLIKPEERQEDDDDDVDIVVGPQSAGDKDDRSKQIGFDMPVLDVSDGGSGDTQQMTDADETSQDNPGEKSLQTHTTVEMADVQSQPDQKDDKDNSQSQLLSASSSSAATVGTPNDEIGTKTDADPKTS